MPYRAFAEVASSETSLASVVPASTSTAEASLKTEPVMLQMADGTFYHPASGIKAPTREHLLALLNGTALPLVDTGVASKVTGADPRQDRLWLAIQRGRAQLAALIVERKKTDKTIKRYKTIEEARDVTLAVWDRVTDQIQLVEILKSGVAVKILKNPHNLTVRVKRTNGVNSEYLVGDGKAVVAVIYPIVTQVTYQGKKVYEGQDVLYTPDAVALRTPELLAIGRETMDGFINDAYNKLRQDGVRSRAFPGQLMADVVSADLVKGIMVIEHTDHADLVRNQEKALQPFFVVVAGNQEDVYAYSKSTAGALGLVQFIPKTYAAFAKRTELNLIKDFEKGMRDPRNAVRAQIAYLDSSLAELPKEIRERFSTNPEQVNEYLAAAYNGGIIRTRRAITAWQDEWAKARPVDVKTLLAQEKKLAATIKKTKAALQGETDATKVKTLKNTLAETKQQQTEVVTERQLQEYASLRKETREYVAKYREYIGMVKPVAVTIAQVE